MLRDDREPTPHRIAAPILTGHFHEGSSYTSWRPRGTDDWLLIYTVSGAGRAGTAPGRERVLLPGDVVLFRPGSVHDYATARGASEWELLWAHFHPRPQWLTWLTVWPELFAGMTVIPLPSDCAADVCGALTIMHERAGSGFSRREDFAMNALEDALLRIDQVQFPFGADPGDTRILQARAFLLNHFSEPITAADVAAVANLSISRLAHLFREQMGQTPQQFLEEQRMLHARELLARTTQSVTAISESVGYANPLYFSLRFKVRTGLSPSAWRQRRDSERANELT